MTAERKGPTRQRLLEAAADLVAASPGQDVPLRAICDAAGVKLPTLYHFFGSKDGLIEAVVDHGFDLYLGVKQDHESSGDPIQDLRAGWDAHVDFGLNNPGFYALMYGQVTPGSRPVAQDRPTELLLALTRQASHQGRLNTDPEQAAAHVLAANVGVTLRQIVLATPDPKLSAAMREATIDAITRTKPDSHHADSPDLATALLSTLTADDGLSLEELALMRVWLLRLGRAETE